jgi:chorismate mutase/prephenate dehydratase
MKIESLPSYKNPFNYVFWIDIAGHLDTPQAQHAMDELKFFTSEIQILGEY